MNYLDNIAKVITFALTVTCCSFFTNADATTVSISDKVLPELHATATISSAKTTSDSVVTHIEKVAFGSKVDEYVSATMLLNSMPGMAIALVKDGQLVYSKGYGFANRNGKIAVTSETLFNLASASKPITAVAAMQLVEQGKLVLESPIQTYVPEFPVKEWPINCRDLLCHQAGIRHYRGNEGLSSDHYDDIISSLEIFKNDPLIYKPGTKFLYSSYGYDLLGAAVQGASGIPFVEYVQKEVLRPAGATNVRVYDGRVDAPVQAVGYLKGPNGLVDAPRFSATSKIPSGGFLASAADVGRFAAFLLNEQLITKQTLQTMIQPPLLADGKYSRYGLGWMLGFWGKIPIASHLGGQPGFTSLIYIVPERKFAAVLLTNISGPSLYELLYRIRDEVIEPKS